MKKIIFLISTILIIFGALAVREIYTPKDPNSVEIKIFSVEKGEGSKQIALNLEREGLIKWDLLFRLYVLFKGISGDLQAGIYELSSSMAIPEIAKKFASGDTIKIKVTLPEGFSLKDIEETLSLSLRRTALRGFRVGDFEEEFDFLKDAPDGALLEGFLFPDTYFFTPNETDKEIIVKFLENFENKIAPYREKISESGKKMFEIITMASLIEKEVYNTEECKNCKELVSGVLWKRLENRIPLQVDATIAYITGKNTTKISIEETKIDSLYNTYKYLGLPVGPIANPGLESILAALYPKSSDSWYYLSTPQGQTIFSKTLEDHNKAKIEYLK